MMMLIDLPIRDVQERNGERLEVLAKNELRGSVAEVQLVRAGRLMAADRLAVGVRVVEPESDVGSIRAGSLGEVQAGDLKGLELSARNGSAVGRGGEAEEGEKSGMHFGGLEVVEVVVRTSECGEECVLMIFVLSVLLLFL